MKFLKDNIVSILMVVIAVMVTLQVSSLFRTSGKPESVIRNEVELEHLKKELPGIREELTEINAKYDSLLSASQNRVQQLEDKKQPIRNAIKNDRAIVIDFDKEQFRRAFAAEPQ